MEQTQQKNESGMLIYALDCVSELIDTWEVWRALKKSNYCSSPNGVLREIWVQKSYLFMTKTAEKPYPLGTNIPPPPPNSPSHGEKS